MFEIQIDDEGSGNLDFTIDVEATDQSSSGLDAYLRIFDVSGTEIDSDDDTFGSDDPSIDITFPSNGTYYIGVSASGNEDYDANVGSNFDAGNSEGGYRLNVSDNNDETNEAIPLVLRTTNSGFFIDHNADADLFEFQAIGGGQRVRFTVVESGGLDGFLRGLSSDGSEFFSIGNGAGSDSTFDAIFPDAGERYFGVSSVGNENYDITDGTGDTAGTTTGGYSISATEVSRTDDTDQISEAVDLGQLGGGVLSNSPVPLSFDVDVDMYKFEVVNDTFVHIDIDLTFPVTGLNSYLRLFDANGVQIESSDNDNSPEENALIPRDSYIGRFLDAGIYYVGVSGSGNENYDPETGINDAIGGVGTGGYDLDIFDGLRVNSTLDGVSPAENQVTLREAIDLADTLSGPNTIKFASSLSGQTITVASELTVASSLTIDGPGADQLKISGGTLSGDAHRVFRVSDSNAASLLEVEINGLTVRDGGSATASVNGAGISNAGESDAPKRIHRVQRRRHQLCRRTRSPQWPAKPHR